MALISIIYLLIRLKSSNSQVLPIYFVFIVVAAVTFMFVVIMNLVGDANAEDLLAKKILKVRDLSQLVRHILESFESDLFASPWCSSSCNSSL